MGQGITLQKVASPTPNSCNQFDVSLNLDGVAPDLPQEVVLVIDNSGSMSLDIPGDPNEPIDYAKDAALNFMTEFFNNNPTGLNRMAVVTYNSVTDINPSGLIGSAGIAELTSFINNIIANGGTNVALGMQTARLEMEANATFDCPTQRNYIVLSDGVANRDLNGNPCSNQPPAGTVTVCMQQAIDEGVAAWLYDPPGPPVEEFEQAIYTVGLFGAITDNDAENAATFTLQNMQNSGYFPAENAVDLGPIYQDILGQIGFTFDEAVVTDQLPVGYTVVEITQPAHGTVTGIGTDLLNWDIGSIQTESLILEYRIEADLPTGCGDQQLGDTVLTYRDQQCNLVSESFPESPVCVPCPELADPEISQLECSNIIDYNAVFTPGSCSPFEFIFTWTFFLNNIELGSTTVGPTTNPNPDLSGQFEYTGSQGPLIGEFSAELTFVGTYNNGNCQLLTAVTEAVIQVDEPPPAPVSGGDQQECYNVDEPQTLTATATAVGDEIILWYDAPQGGNQVVDPVLDSVGAVTYYAEAVSNDNNVNCASISRTPVSLVLYDCSISIEKTASPDNPNGCTPLVAGSDISYTFTVINLGERPIGSVELNDFLIDDTNPIPGPLSGDTNNNDILDLDEIWTYSASYALTPEDISAGQVDNTATVDGTVSLDNGSFGVSGQDSETVVICQDADLALIKTAEFLGDNNNNGCADAGDTLLYRFQVANVGNTPLVEVTINDPLVEVIGNPLDLQPGDSNNSNFTAVYTLVEQDITTTTNGIEVVVVNQAIVSGVAPDGSLVQDLSDDDSLDEDDPTVYLDACGALALIDEADLMLEKTGQWIDVNGDGIAQAGERVSYRFNLINNSDFDLFDVMVSDPLPGITIEGDPIGLLPARTTIENAYTASYLLTQEDIDNGEVINQAVVSVADSSGAVLTDLSDDPDDPADNDLEDDGEPDDPTFVVLPVILPGAFEIFNGITPDGDGRNDYLIIQGIQNFPGNNVKIFNRWGVLVWETDNYGGADGTQNVFRGESDGRATIRRGEMLPAGTYYYILTFTGSTNPGQSSYAGYLYINR